MLCLFAELSIEELELIASAVAAGSQQLNAIGVASPSGKPNGKRYRHPRRKRLLNRRTGSLMNYYEVGVGKRERRPWLTTSLATSCQPDKLSREMVRFFV